MARRPTPLSEQELADWNAYASQVRPLPGRETVAPAEAGDLADAPSERRVRSPAPRSGVTPAPLAVGSAPGGLDSASWHRFRSGRLAPTRTLDLHGRTAQRAFLALSAFLAAAHADGHRCVEIITGRGTGAGGGVLRRELPEWLNGPDLRPLVLAAAHPHAANQGAVRVLLRRTRS